MIAVVYGRGCGVVVIRPCIGKSAGRNESISLHILAFQKIDNTVHARRAGLSYPHTRVDFIHIRLEILHLERIARIEKDYNFFKAGGRCVFKQVFLLRAQSEIAAVCRRVLFASLIVRSDVIGRARIVVVKIGILAAASRKRDYGDVSVLGKRTLDGVGIDAPRHFVDVPFAPFLAYRLIPVNHLIAASGSGKIEAPKRGID